jgi:hypothetical protein
VDLRHVRYPATQATLVARRASLFSAPAAALALGSISLSLRRHRRAAVCGHAFPTMAMMAKLHA